MPLSLSYKNPAKREISTVLVLTMALVLITHPSDAQTDLARQPTILAEEQDYALAVGLHKDGVYQLAEEQLAKFLRRYPSSLKTTEATYLLNECQFYQENYGSAVSGFLRFTQDFSQSSLAANAFFRIGECQLKLKKPLDAIAAFKTVLDKYGESELAGESAYWVGESNLRLEEFDSAIKYFMLGYENYPRSRLRDYSLFSVAWTYQKKSDFTRAAQWYERFLKEFPQSPLAASAKVRIGGCYYYAKDHRKATEVLSQSRGTIQQADERGEADYLIAEAFFQLGDFPEAQRRYEAFLKDYPNHTLQREVTYALGWSQLKQNNFARAAQSFDENAKGNDELAHVSLYRRAVAEKSVGNRRAADATLAEVVKRNPKGEFTDNALFDLGTTQYENRNIAEAKMNFLRITTEFPASDVLADAFRMLGECYASESNFKEAREWYEKAATLPGASFDIKLNSAYQAALCLYKLAMYKEASAGFAGFIKEYPRHPKADEAQFWRAEAEYQLGNLDAALSGYTIVTVSTNKEKQEQAMYGIAWCHFKKKEFSKAIDAFEKLIAAFPNGSRSFDARLRLGDTYVHLKDHKKGVGTFRTVIRLFPKNDGIDYAYYQLGQSLFRDANYTEAYQQFEGLVKTLPNSNLADDAQYALGWINFQRKEYGEAIKEFQRLIATYDRSDLLPRALYSIGDSYYNMQQYADAVKAYRDLIAGYPRNSYVADALNGIQYCLVAQGKQKEAIDEIDTFVASNPNSTAREELLLKKGNLLYSQKNYAAAEREYRRFVGEFPKSKNLATAYYWIARSLREQDRLSDAAFTYESAIGTVNANARITALSLYEVAEIYARQNNYDQAFAAITRIEREFMNSEVAPDAAYAKGNLYIENGDRAEAKNQFDAVIAQFPETSAADRSRIAIVRILVANRDFDAAQTAAQAIATSRTNEMAAEAQFLSGSAYAQSGDWKNAITAYLRVKYAFPAYVHWLAKSYLGLGEAYRATNDRGRARESYQNVLKLDKETDAIAEAEQRLKDLE